LVPSEKDASRFFKGIRTPTTNRLFMLADCLDFREPVKARFFDKLYAIIGLKHIPVLWYIGGRRT